MTCPVAIVGFRHPIGLYSSLLANVATYVFVGLMVEVIRRQLPGHQQTRLYLAALNETDTAKLSQHLTGAKFSIEQRLLNPIEENSEEFRAIKDTWLGIETLERTRYALVLRVPTHDPGNQTFLRNGVQ